MKTNLTYAKAHLSELLDKVEEGREITIIRNGKPIAKLINFNESTADRKLGQLKGKIRLANDFDELPQDILKAWSGD